MVLREERILHLHWEVITELEVNVCCCCCCSFLNRLVSPQEREISRRMKSDMKILGNNHRSMRGKKKIKQRNGGLCERTQEMVEDFWPLPEDFSNPLSLGKKKGFARSLGQFEIEVGATVKTAHFAYAEVKSLAFLLGLAVERLYQRTNIGLANYAPFSPF